MNTTVEMKSDMSWGAFFRAQNIRNALYWNEKT